MNNLSNLVCGIDEAGRGAFAGPLVCAAVVLPDSFSQKDFPTSCVFRDSKKMTPKQRDKAYKKILGFAKAVETEFVGVDSINRRGIGWANKIGITRLMSRVVVNDYIVDGNLKFNAKNVRSVVGADAYIPSVLCAGIVAKVTRDRYIDNCEKATIYNWTSNKGYGTVEHRRLILKYGLCDIHRLDFIETFLKNERARKKSGILETHI